MLQYIAAAPRAETAVCVVGVLLFARCLLPTLHPQADDAMAAIRERSVRLRLEKLAELSAQKVHAPFCTCPARASYPCSRYLQAAALTMINMARDKLNRLASKCEEHETRQVGGLLHLMWFTEVMLECFSCAGAGWSSRRRVG